MDTRNIINNSFSIMRHNKLRTGLTMLGIIIGISAVIIVSSIGKGEIEILNKVGQHLSENSYRIYVQNTKRNYRITDKTFLTVDEINDLRNNPNISGFSPFYTLASRGLTFLDNRKIIASSSNSSTIFAGINSSGVKAMNYKLLYGNEFIPGDSRNFVIIDDQLALKLFGTKNAVGKLLKLNYNGFPLKFNIMGVIDNPSYLVDKVKDTEFSRYFILIPFNWLVNDSGTQAKEIYVRFKDGVDCKIAINQLMNSIKSMKNIPEGIYHIKPVVRNYSNTKKSIEDMNAYIFTIALIILFVGGVGVMIMMLLVINERKSEIGLRKALGAKNRDIVIQFLLESIILSFSGGVIGIIIGLTGCLIAGIFGVIPPLLDWNMLLIAILFSVLTGVIFGIYPAYKAAKFEAIETLKELE